MLVLALMPMLRLQRHSIDVMVMIGHAVAGLNDVKSIEKELRVRIKKHCFSLFSLPMFLLLCKEPVVMVCQHQWLHSGAT